MGDVCATLVICLLIWQYDRNNNPVHEIRNAPAGRDHAAHLRWNSELPDPHWQTQRVRNSGEKSVSNPGVDLTLNRRYLAMSPTERLRAWRSASRLALEFCKHAPQSQDTSESTV